MEQASLLLPVSTKYGEWIKNRYPEYKDRVGAWTLGYDAVDRPESGVKTKGLILAAGGNTPQKNNNQVSNAVAGLNGTARIEIYGTVNYGWAQNINENTRWMGKVSNNEFLQKLAAAELFVVNSTVESFSIALMEAVYCGCSILASSDVGALDLLEVEDTDIILNVNDVDEIRSKMQYLLDHPNHDRICAKLDWEKISYARSIERLRQICEEIYQKKAE